MTTERLPKLHPDRNGYLFDGQFIEGFAHRPDLGQRGQLRLARWAKQYGGELSAEQRDLLGAAAGQPPSSRARMARTATEALRHPWVHLMWETLSPKQQQLVLAPDKHPQLGPNVTWPMTTSQLATLVGCEDHQIRRWADHRKLPHWRKGRNRLFPQAAAIVGFALAGVDQLDQSYASRVVKPGGLAHLKLSVGLAAMRQAASEQPRVDELKAFAGELRQLADGVAALAADGDREPAEQETTEFAAGVLSGAR